MQITAVHKKAVDHYYHELAAYQEQDVTHETAVRSAFQNLLAAFAPHVNWMLVPEEPPYFPYYTYAEDGSNRRENITGWALAQFQDGNEIAINEWLMLSGLPQQCYQYRLGNRSALEWVIDQYQVSTDKRSGITSDPNRLDEEQYIVRLVGKMVTVSVETVKLVEKLARDVKQDEWLRDTMDYLFNPSQ